jgi:hypothetical protein
MDRRDFLWGAIVLAAATVLPAIESHPFQKGEIFRHGIKVDLVKWSDKEDVRKMLFEEIVSLASKHMPKGTSYDIAFSEWNYGVTQGAAFRHEPGRVQKYVAGVSYDYEG